MEDNGKRPLNHFHNPLKDWNSAKFDDFPPGGAYLLATESSILWAQDGSNEASYGEGDWSWATVRGYYYRALTATRKSEREEYFARTFKGVGHQIHFIQDASSPKHVRNVNHLDDAAGGADLEPEYLRVDKPEGTLLIETWTARKGEAKVTAFAANPVFPSVLPDVPVEANGMAPVPITQFIDANIYTGANPSTSLAQGLAEYANANFFGKYPEFPEDLSQSDKHYFPYPKKTSTDVDKFLKGTQYPETTEYRNETEISFFIKKTGDGETIEHFIRPTYHYKDLQDHPLVYSKSLHMDDTCHGDYLAKLIPRAVGYSASLIDYFFRGKITVKSISTKIDNAGDIIGVDLWVKNVSKLGATRELMEGGNFSLAYNYTPPTAGADTVYGLIENFATADSAGAINDEFVHLDPGPLLIPYGSTDIYFTLVYRGKLGGENDAVVGKGIPLTSRIAYTGQIGCGTNDSHIYTVDRDGTDNVKVTDDSDGYKWRGLPSWSSDGKMLVFNGITSDNHYDIVVVDLTSEKAYPKSIKTILHDSAAHYITPSFSPDGTKIVAERQRLYHPSDETDAYNSIVVFNVASGTWVFVGDVKVWQENGPNEQPRWSPKGDRIVFQHYNGYDDQGYSRYGIWSIGYPGTSEEPTALTDEPYDSRWPAWSPDGERIVFASRQTSSQNYSMWIMDKTGGNRVELTDAGAGCVSFSFSPDGRKIVFQVVGGVLGTINQDRTGLCALMQSDWCNGTPAWSPHIAFPDVDMNAYPKSIVAGGSSTLTWEAGNGVSCTIEPDIGAVKASDSVVVTPSQTTTYTIKATGPFGTAASSVTVTVGMP